MLRQLLTLLAVISGFTLAAEPVSATDARVVSVTSLVDQVECQPAASTQLQFRGGAQAATAAVDRPCLHQPVIVWTPTVRLQVDRARE